MFMKIRSIILVGGCCAVAALAAGCGSSGSSTSSATATTATAEESQQHVFEADHFATGAIVGDVANVSCTLSGGTKTTCASVTVAGYPTSYAVGPFCPRTITTPAADAGIWFDGTELYNLDGSFIKNLATFYDDSEWKLYDSQGNVKVTDTKAAFDGAARPDVLPQYQNHCVEGRLAWLADGKAIQSTVVIPLQPVKAASPSSSHPGSGNFGISLDGVILAEAAPVDAILGAHTIAAFDDCGGHFNPVAGYHVHGVMGCGHLEGDATAGETKMLGYAMDGYPIHLPLTGAALAAAKLDECNGHSTAGEGYHYHANGAAKNAILPCLSGEYVSTGGQAGGPPDLAAAAAKLGITETQLTDAFGTTMPPDFAEAAKKLGITEAELKTALGVPG
jgi:hypothetical protein